MARASISVGDNTATGEPENGPKGPYITDNDDGTRPRSRRRGRRGAVEGQSQPPKQHPLVGPGSR
jgi:hypothetical protein